MLALPSLFASFPENFYWGVATSAHQVEGGNTLNDWYHWENHGGSPDRSGDACDFYHRYDQDFQLTKDIHQNAFRLSIEWSRIEPVQGQFNSVEIEHYRKVLLSAKSHGLSTFVTLHHFTGPQWFASVGGWLNPRAHLLFKDYVSYAAKELGGLVDFWITVNEPNVVALTGYVVGASPPGIKNIKLAMEAYANMAQAHAEAYHVLHQELPGAQVGFAHHMRVQQPSRKRHPLDRLFAKMVDSFWNTQILNSIKTGKINFHFSPLYKVKRSYPRLKGSLDFLGINYYTRDKIRFNRREPTFFSIDTPSVDRSSDIGMEIYPQGLSKILKVANRYGWPIFITENGIADTTDVKRPRFICDHLQQLEKAIEKGIPVRGYFHWSLMDNFEWSLGYAPRFGLYEVDYATQKRTLRPSGALYGEIARSGETGVCFSVE